MAIRVAGLGWVSESSSGWYVTVVAGVDVDSFSPRGTVNLWGFCSVWPGFVSCWNSLILAWKSSLLLLLVFGGGE